MHHHPEQTKQGLNEKPQAFIRTHQHTNKCTENNHRNKELTILETFLSAFQRCGLTPVVVFKAQYKSFGVWDNRESIFRNICSK